MEDESGFVQTYVNAFYSGWLSVTIGWDDDKAARETVRVVRSSSEPHGPHELWYALWEMQAGRLGCVNFARNVCDSRYLA